MTESTLKDRVRARTLRLRRILANQADVYRRRGLRGNVEFFRGWRAARLPRGTYSNGLRVYLSDAASAKWARNAPPVVLVQIAGEHPDAARWAHGAGVRIEPQPWIGSWGELATRVRRDHPGHSVLLVAPNGSLPTSRDLGMLQYAAATYAIDGGTVGAVSPALETAGGAEVLGFEWSRADREWAITPPDARYGRLGVPRYVLAAPEHGLLVTAEMIIATADEAGDDARAPIRAGWQSGLRTIALPMVRLSVDAVAPPSTTPDDLVWLAGRHDAARTEDGRLRFVYVLKATTISGGIRTVFEQTRVLRDAGHDVEIWSLQGEPEWIDNTTPIRTFADFPSLRAALEQSDAITVATWWETAQIVWLASVNRGIPVYYVQEFETWFYPGDEISQSAVAASYRLEMDHVTIADYQRGELAELGVPATTISSAYDPAKFMIVPTIERRDDTVLAVGRTFFQKNFAMTLAAWRGLGERRPRFQLYGFEPELVDDPRMVYEARPSDARVNELYNEATCFVQTSLHEGFCLPVLEAMAAGCPVITTDSHGNRDFCDPEENCIMVEQHDVDGLSAAIERVLGDADLRERLRTAGLRTAERHTWTRVCAQLAEHGARLD